MSAVPFERLELIAIRERAQDLAASGGFVPGWQRAHLEIADAVDRLDAMMARCSGRLPNVPDQPGRPNDPPPKTEPAAASVASDG